MANDRKILGIILTAEGTQDVQAAFRSLGDEGKDAADRIKKAFESVNFKGDLGATVKKELAGMGKAGEDAAKKINDALAKVGIGESVTARIVRLRRSFADLGNNFKLTRSGFSDIAKGADQMVAGIDRSVKAIGLLTAAVGGAAFVATRFANSSAATAEAIQNQATAFGVSFENMQRLRNVINDVGGDEGLLERAFTKFTAGLEGTNEAAESAAAALAKLQKQKREDLKNADTQAEKDKVTAKYKEKIADATAKLQKAQAVFNSTSQSGLDGAVEYAQRLNALGDSQKQLAQVTQDFGAKGAVTLLAFFQNLVGEFDTTQQALDKMLPALDELGQTSLSGLDTAGDKLSTNFSRLALLVGSRIAPAFTAVYDTLREIIGTVGPALADAFGGVANSIAAQITENKAAIIDFARSVTASAVQIARDISSALSGVNGTSTWITKLKNDVTGAFEFIRGTITNVLVPAFNAFSSILDPVAKALNALFGTEFTGNALAAVVIFAQLSGGMKVLTGAFNIAYGSGKILFDLIFNGKAKVLALIEVMNTLYAVVSGAARALLLLLAANPEIAAIVAAVAGLAAFIIYLKSQQTDLNAATVEAKKVSDEYTEALKKATDGTRESTAALLEKQEALLNNRRFAVLDARDAVAAAEAEVAEAEATAKSIVGFRAKFTAQNAVTTARSRLSAATADLALKERNLQQEQARVAAGQKALTEGLKKTSVEATKATGAVSQFKTINLYGPGGLIKSFQVLPESVLEARRAAQKLKDSLSQPGDNKLLEEATARAQDFIAKVGEFGDKIQAALIQMSADASAQLQALADAIPAFFDGVPAALAGVFSGVGSSFTAAWRNAMAEIVAQTRQMISTVSALVNNLKATLSSLTAAIRSASAQSKSSGGGLSGGGGRGFAVGGMVRGPGTGTSDSIPAWLSNNEFVLRSAAVAKIPLGFLHALNSAQFDFAELLRRFMGSQMRFAAGGLVRQPKMSFSGLSLAGAGGPTSSLTLVIGGDSFPGLSGPADTIQRLERAMKTKRLRSTGRGSPYER